MKINLFCVTRNNSYDRQLSILRFVQKINQKNYIYLDLKFIGDSAPNLLKFFRQSYTPSSWIDDLNTGRKYFLSNIENILDKERESLAIDQIFHKSKYILTVRDSEKWFESLCNFHLIYFRKMGMNFKNITEVKKEHIKKFNWIKEGYYYNYTKKFWVSGLKDNQIIYDWNLLYDKDHYIYVYEKRNEEIQRYFQKKKRRFISF